MNIPQEKAKELVNKYFKESDLLYEDLTWIQAKECAKIAIYEILSMGIMADSGDWNMAKEYWEEVKNEIEKL